jgi:hypothetical protein
MAETKVAYTAERVYLLGFWRDYVWVYAIFGLIGIISFMAGAFFLSMFLNEASEGIISKLSMACVASPFTILPFTIAGWLLIWLFWFATGQKVRITQDYVTHSRLRMFLPWHVEIKIPVKDVITMELGPHMKKKLYPESKTYGFGGLEDGSGFRIYYKKEGKNRSESMPAIRKKEYYDEIRRILETTKPKQTK